jgi:putative transposase
MTGSELIAWALRDWCRLVGTQTLDIEPGSPWENPFVESFNGRVRDELLNGEDFATVAEAQVIVEAWRVEYNTERPHSALGGRTPDEYAHRYGTRATARLAEAGQARASRWRSPYGRGRGPKPHG